MGAEILKERVEPLVLVTSSDGTVQWCIHGGLAPMANVQEGAFMPDGVQGLHPPVDFVEHKGARQHGVTTQHTVYDPAEIDLKIELTAVPTPSNPREAAAAMRRVIRDWIATWDPAQPSKLEWITPDMGRWTCYARLYKSPPDRQFRAQARRLRQTYTWTVRNDDAFWRGVDSVSDFRFTYSAASDAFMRDDSGTLGPQWQQTYTGAGAGTCETDGNRARWFPSGNGTREVRNRLLGVNEVQTVTIVGLFSGGTWTLKYAGQTTSGIAWDASAAAVQAKLEALSNIAPGDVLVTGDHTTHYTVTFLATLGLQNVGTMEANGAGLTPDGTAASAQVATTLQGSTGTTTTDNQVVSVDIGEPYQWPFPTNGYLDLWGRMNNNDTTPTAVRARIGGGEIVLSRFNSGTETVMKRQPLLIPPAWWEDWSLVCGTPTNPRHFAVYRNKFRVLQFKETGTGSQLGASYRGSGWGMKAAPGLVSQAVPPSIDSFSVGVNATVTQSGHLSLTNFGDQDGYARYLCYGPGTFKIGNGPGATDYITFGPLADNQIALLTTLPRLRGVVDLTPEQPEQQLTQFQDFISRLIGLATSGNVPPLLEWFESLLGIRPPQGELYSLLQGRFTRAIPKKPVSGAPTVSKIACEIVNGNAESKIIAALTPLRRWPE